MPSTLVKGLVFTVPAAAPVRAQLLPAAGASSESLPAPPSIVPVTVPAAERTNRSAAEPPVRFWMPVKEIGDRPVAVSVPAFDPVSVQTLARSGPISVFTPVPPTIVTAEVAIGCVVLVVPSMVITRSVPDVAIVTEWVPPSGSVFVTAVWKTIIVVAVAVVVVPAVAVIVTTPTVGLVMSTVHLPVASVVQLVGLKT